MFHFDEAVPLLTAEAPIKPRVIYNGALRELKDPGVRIGLFTVEAPINLCDWYVKRDAIVNYVAWSNKGMKPYLFPMTHGYNSQAMLIPTVASLVDLTNFSPAQKESAHLHQTTHGNAPVLVALGTVLADLHGIYNPNILFGRSRHLENPATPNLVPAAADHGPCSSIQLNCECSLNFEMAP